MLNRKTQKIIISGVMLALGVLLPLVTAHGFGVPGTIFLPMHLPVLLCGIVAGPLYGGVLGLILPFLNSFLTGMPVAYPTAVIMTFELFTYGFASGLIYKIIKSKNNLVRVYLSLIAAMLLGRMASGFVTALLFAFTPNLKSASVVAATLTGLPGIAVQLVLIPALIHALGSLLGINARASAGRLVDTEKFSCVVIKGRKTICAENCRGISLILELSQKGKLKNTFVADDIIGKAAAMIFTAGGVKSCYGKVVSRPALEWLISHKVEVKYSALTDNIINREGTGLCPMESTVINIDNHKVAVELLQNKLKELQNNNTSSLS